MIRFATNLTMMFTEHPLAERFAAAKAAGFAAVECQQPYELPAAEIARILKKTGQPMLLINTPPGNAAAGERGLGCLVGREADFEAAFARTMDYVRTLGVKYVHVMAGVPATTTDPSISDQVFLRNLKGALAHSAGSGVTLLVEPLNHRDFPGYHLTKFAHARRLIDAVGDERLQLQLDLYNRQISEGDLERALREYIDIAPHIQIAGAPGRNEPDVGEINYAHLFRVIDEIGYKGWVGCEYRPLGGTVAGLGWREKLAPQAVAGL
ncbi:MAG: TIM barrel protein [Bauldia sp.]